MTVNKDNGSRGESNKVTGRRLRKEKTRKNGELDQEKLTLIQAEMCKVTSFQCKNQRWMQKVNVEERMALH